MWLRLSIGPALRLTFEAAILGLAGGWTCETVPFRAPAMSTSTTPPLTANHATPRVTLRHNLGAKAGAREAT